MNINKTKTVQRRRQRISLKEGLVRRMIKTIWIDGKKMAAETCEKLKVRISNLSRPPQLDVIWVGENAASQIYVNHKKKLGESIGITVHVHHLPEMITQNEIRSLIDQLNQDKKSDGILVQLPLPKHLDSDSLLEDIDPTKDVDGLSSFNLGRLICGTPQLMPCTPQACLKMIESVCSAQEMRGKTALVIGRSRLVGKPMFQLLLTKHCTVIQAHSKTENLRQMCRLADIVVVATGHPGLIGADDIKIGAIVIDVGISKLPDGSIRGDVRSKELEGIARAVSPVPGGVGPMTVAMLMENTVHAAEMHQ